MIRLREPLSELAVIVELPLVMGLLVNDDLDMAHWRNVVGVRVRRMLEIELQVLLDEPQIPSLLVEDLAEVGVDGFLNEDGRLINLLDVLLDGCEGFKSAGEFEVFPPLRNAIGCAFLNHSPREAELIYRVNDLVRRDHVSLSAQDASRPPRHLDAEDATHALHEFGDEDHEYLVVLVKVVGPNTIAKGLHQGLVLCVEAHDLLIVVEDLGVVDLRLAGGHSLLVCVFDSSIRDQTKVLMGCVAKAEFGKL